MKRHSRTLSSALGLALLPLLLSCNDPVGLEQDQSNAKPEQPFVREKPMSLHIQAPAAHIEMGETIRLRAVLQTEDGEVVDKDLRVRWFTSAPDKVMITEEGYATGVALGDSRITAESKFGSDWTYLSVRKYVPGRDRQDEGERRHHLEDEEGRGDR